MASKYAPFIDFSPFSKLYSSYEEGLDKSREEAFRQELKGTEFPQKDGVYDYSGGVKAAQRAGYIPGIGLFSGLGTAQSGILHQRVMEGLKARELQQQKEQQGVEAGFKERTVKIAEEGAKEKPTYSAPQIDENTGTQYILETLPYGQGMNRVDLATGKRESLWSAPARPGPATGNAAPSTTPSPGAGAGPLVTVPSEVMSPAPIAAQPPPAPGAGAVAGGLSSATMASAPISATPPPPLVQPPATPPPIQPPPAVVRPPRPEPLALPPIGAGQEYRKKQQQEAATADAEKRAASDEGQKVLKLVDKFTTTLIDNPDDPTVAEKFSRAVGPVKSAMEASSPTTLLGMPNIPRLLYEQTTTDAQKKTIQQVQQYTQAINSVMQRALLKGGGPITDAERASVDKILGAVMGARSAQDAKQLLENFKELAAAIFQARGISIAPPVR